MCPLQYTLSILFFDYGVHLACSNEIAYERQIMGEVVSCE